MSNGLDNQTELDSGTNQNIEKIKLLYEQTSKMHDQIADFRAKLLGLLPLASGAGIFLLLGSDIQYDKFPYLAGIGLFGVMVTAGLTVYELNGIYHCLDLEKIAAQYERFILNYVPTKNNTELKQMYSPFAVRDDSITLTQTVRLKWGQAFGVKIGVRKASRTVYSSVAAGWSYVAALGGAAITRIILFEDICEEKFFGHWSTILTCVVIAALVYLGSIRYWMKNWPHDAHLSQKKSKDCN